MNSEKLCYTCIIAILGAAIVIVLIFMGILALAGKPMPGEMIAIGFSALGYLGGLLTPSPRGGRRADESPPTSPS